MYIVDLGDDLLLESLMDQDTHSDTRGGFLLEFKLFRTLIFIFECITRLSYEERKCQKDEGQGCLSQGGKEW